MKPIELTESDKERFWSKVDIRSEDECWPWYKRDGDKEYGQFFVYRNNKQIRYRAHRVALFIQSGLQGEIARHSCDNPMCCNPKHLQWGTHQDNMDDMVSRNRQGIRHDIKTNATLNQNSVIEIRRARELGESVKSLCNRFGVANQTIYDILNRNTWTNI